MADLIFENPKLARIYDDFDGPRKDLENYLKIAFEVKANEIVDVGCGTGCFATLLSMNGFSVTALDPAKASLEVAMEKPCLKKINWIHGTTEALKANHYDTAFMTGNVAQVFLSDLEWEQTLKNIRTALKKGGNLIFEVRDPSQKAWLHWNKKETYHERNLGDLGRVSEFCEVTKVDGELISFQWTYFFESTGETLTSLSTLRFRSKENISISLAKCGFEVVEVRDASDRPGKEWVFLTKRC